MYGETSLLWPAETRAGCHPTVSVMCQHLLCAAGLVQAVFTVSVLIFFIPIYYNFYLSFLWQVTILPTCPECCDKIWGRVPSAVLKACDQR